jgi:hypothetical protein
MARVIAYLQLAGAGVAAVWVALRPVGAVDRRGMIVLALAGAVFAVVLLRAPMRVLSRWLMGIALIGLTLLAGYTFFGGGGETPFAVLCLVAAAAAVWLLTGSQASVLIGWIVVTHALALWFARAPGGPFLRSPERGARTLVWLATSQDAAGLNGEYVCDEKVRAPSAQAQDDVLAAALWEKSAELAGIPTDVAA